MHQTKNKKIISVLSRLPIYLFGILVLGFGIVLCVKCEMGVSPINSIPYVATHLIPFSLGTLSIFFYLVNIALELILSERKYYVSIFLQLPVSLAFGLVIDLWDALLPSAEGIAMRIIFLLGSLFFTAFGIMLIISMDLVSDPHTGAVQAISRASKKNIGPVKIAYDCSCVVLALLMSILGLHHLTGFGIATIASALFVGRILTLLQNTIGKRIKKHFFPAAQ